MTDSPVRVFTAELPPTRHVKVFTDSYRQSLLCVTVFRGSDSPAPRPIRVFKSSLIQWQAHHARVFTDSPRTVDSARRVRFSCPGQGNLRARDSPRSSLPSHSLHLLAPPQFSRTHTIRVFSYPESPVLDFND